MFRNPTIKLCFLCLLILPAIGYSARKSEADLRREERRVEAREELENQARQQESDAARNQLIKHVRSILSKETPPTGLTRLRDNTPASIRSAFMLADTQRHTDKKNCLRRIERAIDTFISAKYDNTRVDQHRLKRAQQNLQEQFERLEFLHTNDPMYIPWILLDDIQTGRIGRFRYPSNVVNVEHEKPVMDVIQVVDERNFIVKVFGKWIWIQNMSTEGIVDDQKIILNNSFEVVGTRTYTTVLGGSKTVFAVEPINLEKYIKPSNNSVNRDK